VIVPAARAVQTSDGSYRGPRICCAWPVRPGRGRSRTGSPWFRSISAPTIGCYLAVRILVVGFVAAVSEPRGCHSPHPTQLFPVPMCGASARRSRACTLARRRSWLRVVDDPQPRAPRRWGAAPTGTEARRADVAAVRVITEDMARLLSCHEFRIRQTRVSVTGPYITPRGSATDLGNFGPSSVAGGGHAHRSPLSIISWLVIGAIKAAPQILAGVPALRTPGAAGRRVHFASSERQETDSAYGCPSDHRRAARLSRSSRSW
jgi:hypothetical protein